MMLRDKVYLHEASPCSNFAVIIIIIYCYFTIKAKSTDLQIFLHIFLSSVKHKEINMYKIYYQKLRNL